MLLNISTLYSFEGGGGTRHTAKKMKCIRRRGYAIVEVGSKSYVLWFSPISPSGATNPCRFGSYDLMYSRLARHSVRRKKVPHVPDSCRSLSFALAWRILRPARQQLLDSSPAHLRPDIHHHELCQRQAYCLATLSANLQRQRPNPSGFGLCLSRSQSYW